MHYNDVHIKMFPAKSGDCFLIEFIKADFRVLIDGGFLETYRMSLRPYLKQLNGEGKRINLMIISHIDQDHINGLKALLKENGDAANPNIIQIEEVWFNGFKHTEVIREEKEIPVYEEAVLQMMANQNILNEEDGKRNISYSQGESVAKLLVKNKYNWNSSVGGKAVCTDIADWITFGEIRFRILNPTQKVLNKLAQEWFQSLKSKCKPVIISHNHIFDDAFEGAYIRQHEDWSTIVKEISANDNATEYDWNALAELEDEEIDMRTANCSSIAVLISYENMTFLFPGDCAIDYFKDKLPDTIDVVKLPHHGSGKNTTKEFIQNTKVAYYLISTDNKHIEHPSLSVIANILLKSQGKIIKNYDIPMLSGIGELERG